MQDIWDDDEDAAELLAKNSRLIHGEAVALVSLIRELSVAGATKILP